MFLKASQRAEIRVFTAFRGEYAVADRLLKTFNIPAKTFIFQLKFRRDPALAVFILTHPSFHRHGMLQSFPERYGFHTFGSKPEPDLPKFH